MTHNIKEINNLINYLNFELHVPYVVDVLLETGRAKNIHSNIEEYAKIIPYLSNICGKEIICNISETNHKLVHKKNKNCGIGETMIYITSDGIVNLCPSLTHRDNKNFGFGSIKILELKKIIEKLFKTYPTLIDDSCAKCEKLDDCKAGCRSRAYHMYGNLYGKDIMNCHLFGVGNEN